MSEPTQYSPIAFLGLVAAYRRKLKDGSQYDKYIPKADLSYDIVTNNGNVAFTVRQMDKYCRETLEDTVKLAPLLKGRTLPETLKKVFDFWYSHCQYKLDKEGVEELRRPRRAWHDGQILSRNPKTEPQTGIDCDCFSIAVGSCLMNLGIDFKFRITKYNAGWQHVYVVVPVPNDSTRYYVVDCVLNSFNEEKTYSDKFDHTMNSPTLSGMPLARLGAIGEAVINVAQDKNDLINGCHFKGNEIEAFGTVEGESPLLKSIYDHIVATRDIMRKEPSSVNGAQAYLKMLDYLIAKWNTPERDAALDLLEKEEARWNAITEKNGAISGFDGDMEMEIGFIDETDLDGIDELDGELDELIQGLNGLGKVSLKKAGKSFISNVKKSVAAVKKVNKAIVTKVNTANRELVKKVGGQKAVDKMDKVVSKVKAVAKKVGAVIKKFVVLSNPLTLVMRAGFLLAMKTNLFQWAQRVYPAYFTLAEAKNMGITEAAWNLSKKGRAALEKVFVGIGGEPSKLEKYIKTGRAHKKLSGLAGFDSLGYEPVTPTVIVSAATALITASAGIAKAGMNNKSYAAAQKQHDAAVTKQTQIKYAKARAVNGLGEADDETVPTDTTDTATDTTQSTDAEVESPEVTEADAKDTKGAAFKKFVTAIKNFFSRKKAKGEAVADSSDIMSELQNDANNPGSAAASVEAIALQKGKDAQAAALAAGKTPAEALEEGKAAYEEAGGGDTGSGGGIMDFIKANPVVVGGIAVVATGIALLAFSPAARKAVGISSKPKAKALNGLGKVAVYRKGHKVKRAKAMLPAGSKVKRVVLK